MKTKVHLGELETEILKYLLEFGPLSVGDVAKVFAESHSLARTTVLTVMERLRKKGLLKRKEVAGVYEYSSKTSKEVWLKEQIQEFIQTTLGGVVSPLVAYLVNQKISAKELKDLEKLIRSTPSGSKGEKEN